MPLVKKIEQTSPLCHPNHLLHLFYCFFRPHARYLQPLFAPAMQKNTDGREPRMPALRISLWDVRIKKLSTQTKVRVRPVTPIC
jgi:hypothetical protein